MGSLDASAQEFSSGLLTVRDAALRKRGNQLVGTALVTEADLRRSIPILQSVVPVDLRRTGGSRSGAPRRCSA